MGKLVHHSPAGIAVCRSQPQVANGATNLLSQLYSEAGAHARSAVVVVALPNGACIEIEMIMEVED